MAEINFIAKVVTTGSIESNVADIGKYVDAIEKKYATTVYTENQIGDAKTDRKNLNNLAKLIGERRRSLIEEFKAPISEFENACKDAEKRIKACSDNAGKYIDTAEQKLKEAKKQLIVDHWNELLKEVTLKPDLNTIFNERWLNKTYTEKMWKADLADIINRIKAAEGLITNIVHENIPETLKTEKINFFTESFVKTLDYAETAQRWNAVIEKRKEQEEFLRKQRAAQEAARLAREEQEKMRAEREAQLKAEREAQEAERKRIEALQTQKVEMPEPVQNVAPVAQNEPVQPVMRWANMHVEGTTEQLQELTSTMKRIGIKFSVIKNADGSAQKGTI